MGEKTGDVGTADVSGEFARDAAQIACPLGSRGDGNKPGVDSLVRPRTLVVSEEEDLVTPDWAAHRAAELVLTVETPIRGKEVSCVEVSVSQKIEQISVICVRTALGDGGSNRSVRRSGGR